MDSITVLPDKFSMTTEENIFVLKRNIIDYIWKSAHLEGIAVTFPDTESIYNGLAVKGMKVDDIITINNLKHAWEFVLDTISEEIPTDYPYVCQLNRIVGSNNLVYNAGFIRDIPVSIGGTSWRPDIPIESQIKEDLARIVASSNNTDKAITMMLYIMRKQMFLDGNKRTAMLAANHELIKNGCGIITIPIEEQNKFRELLINYYETADMGRIKNFVYEKCLDGFTFKKNKTFLWDEPSIEQEQAPSQSHVKVRTRF